MTLRSKLIGVSLIPALIMFALFAFVIYGSSRQALEDELGRRLISIGQSANAHFSRSVDAKQIARIDASKKRVIARFEKRVQALKRETKIERAMIFKADGTSIADSDGTPFGEKIYVLSAHESEIKKSFSGEPTTSVLFSKQAGGFDKIGFVPIKNENEVVALIGIVGSADYFQILTDLTKILALLTVIGIILIILITTFFAQRLTDPIQTLVKATKRFGKGELDTPVEISSKDEVGILGRAFEEMRNDILQRDEQMQMMLSGIAHEVRNPLGGMTLFLGMLREDLIEEKERNQTSLFQVAKIERELNYLDNVVSDFLNFAKNSPLLPERFFAKEFLLEIEGLLEGEAEAQGVEIQCEISEECELVCDREKIKSAIINVVRNAIQACVNGGEITISVESEKEKRRIIIKDNGPGIPEEVLENILTPFFTTKEKGSGLGLALAQRFLQQHRGDLEIKTKLGIGSEVTFSLPFDASIEATPTIPEGWLG